VELSWLEDFLALIETANFSRAAERRNMTQPAFSRRIRALENWVGGELFDRSGHRLVVTKLGEDFRPVAEETLRRLYQGRDDILEGSGAAAATLTFASTHLLSFTFLPNWMRSLEEKTRTAALRVTITVDVMEACEKLMLQGRAQFLLCHHHASALNHLGSQHFCSVRVGSDVLVPVSAPIDGSPRFHLPGAAGAKLPLLDYTDQSAMGRILRSVRAAVGPPAWLESVFTSQAMVVRAEALAGRGVAWSPLSLVEEDLANGRLVRAGDEGWDVPVEIRVFRPRSPLTPAAEKLWSMVA
jgi:LysR family transcriptional regulator, hypochlorite-specific transcription factor HypT